MLQHLVLNLAMLQTYHPEFLSATTLNWNHLFAGDQTKTVVVDSLQWLVQNKRCAVNAFLIMPNHIHLICKIADGFEQKEGQGAFTHRCWRGRQHQPELYSTNFDVSNSFRCYKSRQYFHYNLNDKINLYGF
jgi:REP element-mobilizing transposase RayT